MSPGDIRKKEAGKYRGGTHKTNGAPQSVPKRTEEGQREYDSGKSREKSGI